ncbi:Uncharacterised protein [Fusobacterium polymorphum]|uniref:Uncharacterized protein n=1 Tax=Fusobacterium polymorphum ATCC 10953 TaxID=393480 RepID=A5TX29_FUSNP|nr:hypothetical protein FNP_1681 [Fusobacterium polymorphum ATCC 10953]CKH08899.1 Uncharacterised protein [Fusobacterium polymorphum]
MSDYSMTVLLILSVLYVLSLPKRKNDDEDNKEDK